MKGGCEIGKKSGQGGCKTGKKKKKGPATKPKTEATKLKGLKVKLEGKKKELVKLQEMKRSRDEAKPKPKIKFKVVKKEVKKPVKKKIKFKIKPAELPELKAITGLTKAQANKLEPAVLFGMLPKELAKDIVLNPKATGVKVGKDSSKKEMSEKSIKAKKLSMPGGAIYEKELEKLPSGEGYSGGKKYFVDKIKDWEKKTEIKYGMKYRYKVPRGASIIGPRKKLAHYNALESSGYLKFESTVRETVKKDDESKFGGSAKLTNENIIAGINRIIRFGTPRAKLGSQNMIKLGNEFGKALFRINRWTYANYDDFNFVNSFKEDQILLKKRLDLLEKTMKDAGVKNASGTYGGSGQRLPEILKRVGLRK